MVDGRFGALGNAAQGYSHRPSPGGGRTFHTGRRRDDSRSRARPSGPLGNGGAPADRRRLLRYHRKRAGSGRNSRTAWRCSRSHFDQELDDEPRPHRRGGVCRSVEHGNHPGSQRRAVAGDGERGPLSPRGEGDHPSRAGAPEQEAFSDRHVHRPARLRPLRNRIPRRSLGGGTEQGAYVRPCRSQAAAARRCVRAVRRTRLQAVQRPGRGTGGGAEGSHRSATDLRRLRAGSPFAPLGEGGVPQERR